MITSGLANRILATENDIIKKISTNAMETVCFTGFAYIARAYRNQALAVALINRQI